MDHPRVEVCLGAGKDSDQRLPGQRGVLPSGIAGVQPAERVQTPLCPTALAASYLAASSPAVVRGAAQLVRPDGVPTLHLAPSYPWASGFLETLRHIRRPRPPF